MVFARLGPDTRKHEKTKSEDVGVVGDEDLSCPPIGSERPGEPLSGIAQPRLKRLRRLAGHGGKTEQPVDVRIADFQRDSHQLLLAARIGLLLSSLRGK